MPITASVLSRHRLPTGLVVEFLDRSRPIAGDRWQVVVEVRLLIPINQTTIPPDLADQTAEVIAALGQDLVFTKQEVRHFIDVREVPALLQEMTTRLWAGLKGYLGHPDFAGRYIRKKFSEYQERQKWYPEESA
ncbi:MAG: hypothetical protein ACUVXF_12660 [Desulfobaccales bacterium]